MPRHNLTWIGIYAEFSEVGSKICSINSRVEVIDRANKFQSLFGLIVLFQETV